MCVGEATSADDYRLEWLAVPRPRFDLRVAKDSAATGSGIGINYATGKLSTSIPFAGLAYFCSIGVV